MSTARPNDSHISNNKSALHNADFPIGLDENNPPRFLIDDEDEVDTTMSHKSPTEVIDVDANGANGGRGPSPPVKIEIPDDEWDWTVIGGQTIDLTVSENESTQTYPSAVDISQTSIADLNLGQSFLQKAKPKPTRNIAVLIEAQRKYVERALKRPVAAGASSIFGGPIGSSDPFAAGSSSFRPGPDPDVQAAGQFEKLKEEYRRKVLLGQNSFADDVMWGKAKAAEKNRIKHIEEGVSISRGIDISSDEAMESDEGPFISQRNSLRKRTHSEVINDSDFDDADQHQTGGSSGERDVVDILGLGGEVTNRIKKKTPSKRQAAKARERDQHESQLAGIEEFLINEERKERKGAKKATPRKRARNTQGPKGKSAKGKNILRDLGDPVRPGQPGYPPNSSSLFSSNVFEEGNNNLDAAPAPQVRENRKDKALKAMLVDIPLEDLRQARGEKQSILHSTKVLGKHGRCYFAGDNRWGLKGMKTTLFHYQVQAAAWMKLREEGDVSPLGGILADEMGLGKTLTTIACMVSNRPESTESSRATLIVCPASLLYQWDQEIKQHTQEDIFPKVLRYRADERVCGTGAESVLEGADVVLTTYDEVRKSYPHFKPPKEIVLPDKKRAWWDENYKGMRGVLHKVRWHRIVLDEAQAIKNRSSQTSIACRGLMAKHRWAVSATPIHNRVGELYAIFKLLRVRHTGNFETFRENFCDPNDEGCYPRLRAFLRQFMMRRTHADRVMGHPLVVLLRNCQRTIVVELNPIERALYDTVQRRFVEAINQCGRDGTLEKSYRSVLHMLLRLRQMTGHPFMVQDVVEDLFHCEEIERLSALTISEDTAQNDPSRNMLAAMKKMIRVKTSPDSSSLPDVVSYATPSEANTEEEFTSQAETNELLVFNFRQFLRGLVQGAKWAEVKARSLCHKCGDVPEVPHVTDCFHLYCLECLRTMQVEAAMNGEQSASCCACATHFKQAKCCTGIAELEMEAPISTQGPGKAPLTGKMASRHGSEKATLRWLNYEGEVLPSTKTAAVVAQVEEWQRAEPNKKIIIFSQFHTL
ncbi:MAG: hypothetical protein Q9200_005280 [Gallowayella weberi]